MRSISYYVTITRFIILRKSQRATFEWKISIAVFYPFSPRTRLFRSTAAELYFQSFYVALKKKCVLVCLFATYRLVDLNNQ